MLVKPCCLPGSVAACGGRLLASLSCAAWLLARGARAGEVQMPPEEFRRLDTFEAHELGKADASFNAGRYRQAAKEYDSFVVQFRRSTAIPYAILRQGRSLHLDEKRFDAIKAYNRVLDYFPNEINYASAALYYIGMANWENADEQEAIKAWAEMAEDKDYNQHFLAGDAILRLADYLGGKGQTSKAADYYRQVARDFRHKNHDAANTAIQRALPHYIRNRLEGTLRDFYREVGTFGRFHKVPDDLENDWGYWSTIADCVDRFGGWWFRSEEQARERNQYYQFWAGTVGERFGDNDDFRLRVFGWLLACEGDQNKWMQRVDKQFADRQKAGDWDRIIKWMDLYAAHKNKAMEYYQKLDFTKLSYGHIRRVMEVLYDRINEPTMARVVFERIKLTQLTDAELADLARYFWKKDPKMVEMICAQIRDRDFASMELLQFFASLKDIERAIPLADALQKSPTYAEDAIWIKGELLRKAHKYAEAIVAYRQSNRNPDAAWRIADCQVGLKQLDEAVMTLREIEAFFPRSAASAAMKIASIYKGAGMKSQYVAELRNVMKKYPDTGESNQAHQTLENMEIGSGGGVDAK